MEAQSTHMPTLEEIEQRRKQSNIPKDQIALMQERNSKLLKTNETPSFENDRKKEVEVPKDTVAMMEEKMKKGKTEEQPTVVRLKEFLTKEQKQEMIREKRQDLQNDSPQGKHHELQRKEELKPQESERIMKEINKEEKKEAALNKDGMGKGKKSKEMGMNSEKQKHPEMNTNEWKENKA